MNKNIALSALLLFTRFAFAEIKLPSIIASNMVLQQKTEVSLWGWADPKEAIEVKVSWNNKPVKTIADDKGNWLVRIKTVKAGGGPNSIIFKGKNTIELTNVLLGEVWLCSGQSNMHFPMGPTDRDWATGIINYKEEIPKANFPNMRLFTVERKVADVLQKDLKGTWEICTPQTVAEFSAVAYYFGREIFENTGFPVGLINSTWGGTPAESFTKREVLENDPDYRVILERYQKGLEDYPALRKAYQEELEKWNKDRAEGKVTMARPREPIGPNHNKSPYKIYNSMIAPLIPFTLKGVIWYQGESNADRAYQYRKLFPDMIASWRKEWGQPDFPFYFVQIAPHRGQNPEIREAQLLTMLKVKNTGMVVITDHGDSVDIHPRNKEVVGKRLSLWALAKDYGKKDIIYSGPVYKSMQTEGDKIKLQFDYADGGLVAKDGELREFTIAGEDQVFHPAKATIEGNSIVVWSEGVKAPKAVRFAWRNVPEANLFNKAGLPASPFRTDGWKGETEGKN